jgi:hypothetical protein
LRAHHVLSRHRLAGRQRRYRPGPDVLISHPAPHQVPPDEARHRRRLPPHVPPPKWHGSASRQPVVDGARTAVFSYKHLEATTLPGWSEALNAGVLRLGCGVRLRA